jgi:hypothetical protein
MRDSKKNKGNNKWITIYRPANVGVIETIEQVYEIMKNNNALPPNVSLGKFVLLSAIRDIERTIAISEAQNANKGTEDQSNLTSDETNGSVYDGDNQ